MTENPLDQRSSGVLLHPTSLWGRFGSGDLGPAAFDFARRLANSGQRWWQMLPVGPVGGGHSPYDSPSSFAGNPALVSLEEVVRAGWLKQREIAPPLKLERARASAFDASLTFKISRLRVAAERFFNAPARARRAYERFGESNRAWLDDYVLFQALASAHAGQPWNQWEPGLRTRKPRALERSAVALQTEMRFLRFVQFQFDEQWAALRRHCEELGVRLLGDVPMFVAGNGADTWSHREYFALDTQGRQIAQVGVPPDDFCPEGQRWGNPPYRWQALARDGFSWWAARLEACLARFHAVRLDHFIGFHRFWKLAAQAETARHGRFIRAPGEHCLATLQKTLGGLPCVAEDLGLLIPEVETLRETFALPGMRILQFGFSEAGQRDRPHYYPENSVAYTGTHDNDTVVGWYRTRASNPHNYAAHAKAREYALVYAGCEHRNLHWGLIRAVMASRANTSIFPLQDLLGLGSDARMNIPGTPSGNWRWRVAKDAFSPKIQAKARELSETHDRCIR